MGDVIALFAIIFFFGLSRSYISGCDRLKGNRS